MPTVVLVRHGETAWNRQRRIQGWAPTRLTETGRRQARAVGDHLGRHYDIDRIVGSDLRRVRDTVVELRGAGDLPIEPELGPAWRERNFGELQGATYEEVFEGRPRFSLRSSGMDAARAVPTGGESLEAMHERVLEGWREIVEGAADGETLVVVSHGGPIRSVLGHVRGLDLVRSMLELEQENCAINEIVVEDVDSAEIVRENEVVGRGREVGTD